MSDDVAISTLVSPEDARLAGESGRRLSARLRSGDVLSPALHLGGPDGDRLALPGPALPLLADLLCRMADDSALPDAREVTAEEAADLLRVPPAYLAGLLACGNLPHRTEGGSVRVPLWAVLEYKRRTDEDRVAAMAGLAAQAQELGMGY